MGVTVREEANGSNRKRVITVTFSEYFNGLYRPLKNEEFKPEFFDKMISHCIDEDACK